MGQRTGPGNEHNKAQCSPTSCDSDVTSFLTAGPGRTIIWLIKIEGHHRPDNNEISRALPFYVVRSVAASSLFLNQVRLNYADLLYIASSIRWTAGLPGCAL